MENCKCSTVTGAPNEISMEEYLKRKQHQEDQIDYQFTQRILQELTQSCALPIPIPASAIPPLIMQAAQHFWENDDQSLEERYYILPYSEFTKCGVNMLAKLPSQIMSVFGVYKTSDSFKYGALGDFSLERMIMNNTTFAGGAVGAGAVGPFSTPSNYSLADATAALYEVSTYKSIFETPLTFNYNAFSNELVILGALGDSDLVLQVFQRVKLQDLYKSYYFFRYCVCLGLRSMSTIVGAFEFKLPGGITVNYSAWRDQATTEMQEIDEWINKNHATDYFFMSNTI